MFPILKIISDGNIHYKKNIFANMEIIFKLSQSQMEETLPSQTEPTYINRMGWVITYLKKAGLLEGSSRTHFSIIKEGMKIVNDNITNLNSKYLRNILLF